MGEQRLRLDYSPPSRPRKVVEAGHLPTALFDQGKYWVDTEGFQHEIEQLPEDFTMFVIDYLLANARRLRDAWSAEHQQEYDIEQRPRRWMLDTPVMTALMRQRVKLADDRAKLSVEASLKELADGNA